MESQDRPTHIVEDPDAVQPTSEGEATSYADPSDDPAQAEWERTEALDAGEDVDADTATGADPDEIESDEDQIPRIDQPDSDLQPESQDEDPLIVDLGEDGEGDLGPNDV
jgi:hypothetical protein